MPNLQAIYTYFSEFYTLNHQELLQYKEYLLKKIFANTRRLMSLITTTEKTDKEVTIVPILASNHKTNHLVHGNVRMGTILLV